MAQSPSNSLDPDVSGALQAALGSIRYAQSVTTAYAKNSLYARLRKLTDELKTILGEEEVSSPAPLVRVLPLSRPSMQSRWHHSSFRLLLSR
jgi:hypothetical protein